LLRIVEIGDFSTISTNATILPNIIIGKNVFIGAGAVVINDAKDNSVVAAFLPNLSKSY